MLKIVVANIILKPAFATIRFVSNYFLDLYESIFGLRDELTPPRRMIFVGGGDYKKIGEEFLNHFIEIGGLRPTDHILEVGCGIGRMAVPLTKYLSKEGSYEGIDIVEDGIKWCSKNITPKFPKFRFQLADVYNKLYHPKGKYQPSSYSFPYDDKSFNFIFLTSVFTHMLPDDMENYLAEISRVLKHDGKCLITFFLLNNESVGHIDKKQSFFDFRYDYGDYRVDNIDVPEAAISFNENFVRNLYEKHSLKIVNPIYYGSWCGRENFLSFQDFVLAIKL